MRAFAALACAVALTGGAGAAQAETIVPVEGSWKAETSAGLPVYFGVEAGHVVNIRFTFHWGFCGTYQSHEKSANLESIQAATGSTRTREGPPWKGPLWLRTGWRAR